jgi:hypothetical protein
MTERATGFVVQVFKLTITISDINDNAPEFDQHTVTLGISENVPPGSRFMLPTAIDRDYGKFDVQSYELRSNDTENRFKLSVAAGNDDESSESQVMLVVTGKLDRETTSVFRAELIATDGGNLTRSGVIEVMIAIQVSGFVRILLTVKSFELLLVRWAAERFRYDF